MHDRIGGGARLWCFTWVVKDAPNDGGHKLDWDKGKREEYLGPERVDIWFDETHHESVNKWLERRATSSSVANINSH